VHKRPCKACIANVSLCYNFTPMLASAGVDQVLFDSLELLPTKEEIMKYALQHARGGGESNNQLVRPPANRAFYTRVFGRTMPATKSSVHVECRASSWTLWSKCTVCTRVRRTPARCSLRLLESKSTQRCALGDLSGAKDAHFIIQGIAFDQACIADDFAWCPASDARLMGIGVRGGVRGRCE
jgi:hypothetical protein